MGWWSPDQLILSLAVNKQYPPLDRNLSPVGSSKIINKRLLACNIVCRWTARANSASESRLGFCGALAHAASQTQLNA